MPLLGTKGAASAQGFGFFTAIGESGFIGLFNNPSNARSSYFVNNSVVVGTGVQALSSSYSNISTSFSQNYNKYLATIDAKSDYMRPGTDTLFAVNAESSGATLSLTLSTITATSTTPAVSTGFTQSPSFSGLASASLVAAAPIYVDSAGAFYYGGTGNAVSGATEYRVPILIRGTASGITWSRYITFANTGAVNFYIGGVITDSSNNVYFFGNRSTTLQLEVFRFNSSGTLNTIYTFGSFTTAVTRPISVARDASNNIYVASRANGDTYTVNRITTTGGHTWNRLIQPAGFNGNPSVEVGPDGFVYFWSSMIAIDDGSKNYGLLIKFDSNGTEQWVRTFSDAVATSWYANTSAQKITFDANGYMYFTANTNTGEAMAFKYPTDGSVTGTYIVGARTVQIRNTNPFAINTGATSTATTSSRTFTSGTNGSASSFTPTLTDGSYTITSTKL
jgi:hypothetical protein